jgi:hypothetical protein
MEHRGVEYRIIQGIKRGHRNSKASRTAAKSTLLSASTTIVWLIDKTLAPKKAVKQ